MPKTTRSGTPEQDELPSTLQRSPAQAQRTFAKTYDAAAEQYDDLATPDTPRAPARTDRQFGDQRPARAGARGGRPSDVAQRSGAARPHRLSRGPSPA